MSVLTKSERDGLDDVFLSIQSNEDKYEKLKRVSSLIISKSKLLSLSKLVKEAKYSIKETKISHFMPFIDKKKKNLRK